MGCLRPPRLNTPDVYCTSDHPNRDALDMADYHMGHPLRSCCHQLRTLPSDCCPCSIGGDYWSFHLDENPA